MRRYLWITVALVALGLWLWARPYAPSGSAAAPPVPETVATAPAPSAATPTHADTVHPAARYPAFLPPEAHEVLQRIVSDGPFPYRQDGSVFHNRERRLPVQPHGYYHEYTVATPGSPDRGARRIITGGNPPVEYWYTDDHYRSFRRFELTDATP